MILSTYLPSRKLNRRPPVWAAPGILPTIFGMRSWRRYCRSRCASYDAHGPTAAGGGGRRRSHYMHPAALAVGLRTRTAGL